MINLEGKEFQLNDGHILIQPYRLSDVDRLYEAARESIPEVSIWLPWCHKDYSIEESQKWVELQTEAWRQGQEYEFTINDLRDGLFLGGCGLNQVNWAQ